MGEGSPARQPLFQQATLPAITRQAVQLGEGSLFEGGAPIGPRALGAGLVGLFSAQAKEKVDSVKEEDGPFAMISNEVYDRPKHRERHVGDLRYEPFLSDSDLAFYKGKNEFVIGIRGGETRDEWRYDHTMSQVDRGLSSTDRYKHTLAIVKELLEQHPGIKVVLTGHGIGGKMAIELVRDLHGKDVRAVTFNAAHSTKTPSGHDLPVRHYHSRGDAMSALGVGKYKHDYMLHIPRGNYIYTHAMDHFMPPVAFSFPSLLGA